MDEQTLHELSRCSGCFADDCAYELKRRRWERVTTLDDETVSLKLANHAISTPTGLEAAMKHGVVKSVIEIIKANRVDIGANHHRCMRWAIEGGHESVVRALLDRGDADVTCCFGSLPIIAMLKRNWTILDMLVRHRSRTDWLTLAVRTFANIFYDLPAGISRCGTYRPPSKEASDAKVVKTAYRHMRANSTLSAQMQRSVTIAHGCLLMLYDITGNRDVSEHEFHLDKDVMVFVNALYVEKGKPAPFQSQ